MSTLIAKNAKNFYGKLGSNPDPLFTIVALCLFNMTLRPLITLSDPNQPKERKMYAAMREFVTEALAMPICIIMSRLAGGVLAKKFARPENINKVKNVFSFAGLLLANFTIPIVGTLIMDPLMNKLKKNPKFKVEEDVTKEKPSLDIVSKAEDLNIQQPKPVAPVKIPVNDNIWQHYRFESSQGLRIH